MREQPDRDIFLGSSPIEQAPPAKVEPPPQGLRLTVQTRNGEALSVPGVYLIIGILAFILALFWNEQRHIEYKGIVDNKLTEIRTMLRERQGEHKP